MSYPYREPGVQIQRTAYVVRLTISREEFEQRQRDRARRRIDAEVERMRMEAERVRDLQWRAFGYGEVQVKYPPSRRDLFYGA